VAAYHPGEIPYISPKIVTATNEKIRKAFFSCMMLAPSVSRFINGGGTYTFRQLLGCEKIAGSHAGGRVMNVESAQDFREHVAFYRKFVRKGAMVVGAIALILAMMAIMLT
jgi:hypothetical protein